MENERKAGSNIAVRLVKSPADQKTKPLPDGAYNRQAKTAQRKMPKQNDIWLQPSINMRGLRTMVAQSSILPQCIRAYRGNIAGYGLGVRYIEEYKVETNEMKDEFNKLTDVLKLLSFDKETKELFEDAIEMRETYGIAFLEVLRSENSEPSSISLINNPYSVRKTDLLEPEILTRFYYKGNPIYRMKRFRKYKMETDKGTVYFKEIGDPRILDKFTGEYYCDDAENSIDFDKSVYKTQTNESTYNSHKSISIPPERIASEILELKIGTSNYGEIRWIGQVLGVDGSRRAETLNNKYFQEGRHTPLLLMVKGGTLTEDSYSRLREYMDGVKGEAGQHAFMILEAESAKSQTFSDEKLPEVEIKSLAGMLQKDELFQDYLENNRKKVQSAFLLPDVFVGYTSDFNRATAQAALEVTERQVFRPERHSLAWVINNFLLSEFKFKFVEAYFLEPDVTDTDALTKLLDVMERAGGITPNKAKEIAMGALGKIAEDYDGDWANTPIAYNK